MSEATICRTCLRLRQDLCYGEKGQTACQWYKRMTNADRIRAMTDAELAKLLGAFAESSTFCYECPVFRTELYRTECGREYEDGELPGCDYIIGIWLKQEVEE